MEEKPLLLCDTNIIIDFYKEQPNTLSHNLSLPDGFIAATAIAEEIPLYIHNTKDFRFIEELNLYQEN
jgi:predicted nucleic acid-binding protein